jgi:hypothetical protein
MARDDTPIHRVAQEVARAAMAARQGRRVELDAGALAVVIDRELSRLLASRREQVLQSLSHRMSRAAAVVQQLESGMTTHDAAEVALELASISGGLRVIAALGESSRAA